TSFPPAGTSAICTDMRIFTHSSIGADDGHVGWVSQLFRTKGLIMKLRLKSGRRRAVVIAALTAGILGVGAGVAAAATTGHTGTSITRVSVLTQNAAVLYTGSAWTNVGTVGVYAGPGQFIDAR